MPRDSQLQPMVAPASEPASESAATAATPTRVNSADTSPAPAKKSGRKPFAILGGIVTLVLLGIGGAFILTSGQESTDDAQVTADLVPLGARVAGQIMQVAIRENQLVKAGDLIGKIDDADYIARVKQAEAEVESARAQEDQAQAQVEIVTATSTGNLSSAKAAYSGSSVGVASADAQVASARAQIVRSEADAHKAETDLNRAKELHAANAVPQERVDNAKSAFDSAEAGLAQARAQLTAAEEGKRGAIALVSEAAGRVAQSAPISAQIAAARANRELTQARTRGAEVALELAKLQLSYTRILAPTDGIASKLSVHEGQLVSAGQPIVALIPTGTYVIANFKETQLAKIRVGARAELSLDAYPHRSFAGKVESISGGTGASFSLLPADNASGNFVKVVQRVPVRIAWVNPPSGVVLRAGLSVDATIYAEK